MKKKQENILTGEEDSDSPMVADMAPSYDPNVTQFALINKLEKKLRALLKAVLKQQDNWYKYIPKEIRIWLTKKKSRKNQIFLNYLNKSLELIDLLMFKDYQLIITSSYSQYELLKYFSNIHYVTERLIKPHFSIIAHSNQLAPDQELTLTNLTNELVMHANEYLGVNE